MYEENQHVRIIDKSIQQYYNKIGKIVDLFKDYVIVIFVDKTECTFHTDQIMPFQPFKVGEKVRIINYIPDRNRRGKRDQVVFEVDTTEDMFDYEGKIAHVIDRWYDGALYRLDIDHNRFSWSNDLLVPLRIIQFNVNIF